MRHGHLFLPAFLAILTSYVAFHIYSASWIARSFSFSSAGTRTIRLVFLLLAFSSPFMMFMRRYSTGTSLDWLFIAGYSWMGVILLTGSVFFLSDALAPAARHFLAPAGLPAFRAGAACVLVLIVAYSFYGGLKAPGLKQVRVEAPGLPDKLNGLCIAHISDMHVDFSYKLGTVARTVDLINSQKPDLVVITGDLVDPGLTEAERARFTALMRGLRPRLGVYGVLGNHEYYYGVEKAAAVFGECGIRLLRNSSADADGVHLIGIGDMSTEGITQEALAGIIGRNRGKGFTIFLTHQPLQCDFISGTGDYLILAGHVHRAQIFPFHIFTRLFYKYFYGLYRLGGSFVYVTAGAGSWGPPMRFLSPAEVPVITLSRAD